MEKGSSGKRKLESVGLLEERHLGIIIRADLEPSSQCNKAATAARRIMGMVRRNFRYLDIEDFNVIYKTYIHPHLEYCIQAWSLHLIKDKSAGECTDSCNNARSTAEEIQ